MKLVKFSFPLFGLMLGSFAAHADVGNGKVLHDKSCTSCHDNSVYSRSDRRIKSLAALQQRVSMCKKQASANWDNKQKSDVIEYLNAEFYHFK